MQTDHGARREYISEGSHDKKFNHKFVILCYLRTEKQRELPVTYKISDYPKMTTDRERRVRNASSENRHP